MNIFNYLTLFFAEDADANADADTAANDANENKADKTNDKDAKNDKADEKKYSDADVDKLLEKKFAKWQKQKEAEINEAKKLADMTATERAEHERDKLQAELNELKAANTRAEMEKTARGILSENGVTVPDSVISCLVTADADTTSKNVKDFSKAFKSAVQAEVKNQLGRKSPEVGGGAGTLTKEQILKEADQRKRLQLIRDNPQLFQRH